MKTASRAVLMTMSLLLAAGDLRAQTTGAGTNGNTNNSGVPVTRFDTVTTTATKSPKPDIDVFGFSSTITRDQIEQRVPSSLDDVIRDLPNIESDGGPRRSAEQITIRGLSNERVVLRVDGARLNFQAGHRGRLFIDPDLLKRVEVVRGPSSIYGSGALGGVVALETVDPRDLLPHGKSYGMRFKFGYQDANHEFMGSTYAFARFGNAEILAGGLKRNSNNIGTGSGPNRTFDVVPFSADNLFNGIVKGVYHFGPGQRAFFTYQGFTNSNFIPVAANTNTSNNAADRTTHEHRVVFGYDHKDPNNPLVHLTTRFYFNKVTLNELVVSGTDAGRRDVTRLTTFGMDVFNTSRFEIWSKRLALALTYGVEVLRDEQTGTRNGGPRFQFPDANANNFGAYVQGEVRILQQFLLLGSMRFDQFDLDSDTFGSRNENDVSFSGGVGWQPIKQILIYGKYVEAFRAPSLTEMFASGVHFVNPGGFPFFGAANAFIPNPALLPEKGAGYEFGGSLKFDDLVFKGDRLRGKFAYFRTRVKNFIELQVLNNPFAPPFSSQSVNRRHVNLEGFELAGSYTSRHFFAGVAYGRTRVEDRVTGAFINNIPADKLVLIAGGRLPEYGVLFGWRVTKAFDQNRVPAGTAQVNGYTTHDLFISWAPTGKYFPYLKGFRFDFAIENLTDRFYQKATSELPEAGRNIKFAVSYVIAFGNRGD